MTCQDKIHIASFIDHTLLKPEATRERIYNLCQEALEHSFASVCVLPYWVSYARSILENSAVKTGTVVAFPFGNGKPEAKRREALECAEAGAEELDMVINIPAALEGKWALVEEEIRTLVSSCPHQCVKVILETCLLSAEQIQKACEAAQRAGAHFVKTSTGFSSGGATLEAVQTMQKAVSKEMGIKASGGIKTVEQALQFIEAGATRIGTSSSMDLIKNQAE